VPLREAMMQKVRGLHNQESQVRCVRCHHSRASVLTLRIALRATVASTLTGERIGQDVA
jgi:hypothetical protein